MTASHGGGGWRRSGRPQLEFNHVSDANALSCAGLALSPLLSLFLKVTEPALSLKDKYQRP